MTIAANRDFVPIDREQRETIFFRPANSTRLTTGDRCCALLKFNELTLIMIGIAGKKDEHFLTPPLNVNIELHIFRFLALQV